MAWTSCNTPRVESHDRERSVEFSSLSTKTKRPIRVIGKVSWTSSGSRGDSVGIGSIQLSTRAVETIQECSVQPKIVCQHEPSAQVRQDHMGMRSLLTSRIGSKRSRVSNDVGRRRQLAVSLDRQDCNIAASGSYAGVVCGQHKSSSGIDADVSWVAAFCRLTVKKAKITISLDRERRNEPLWRVS